jgi:hypothetical protein
MVEYAIIIMGGSAAVLFLSIKFLPRMLDAIGDYVNSFYYLLSLPIP